MQVVSPGNDTAVWASTWKGSEDGLCPHGLGKGIMEQEPQEAQ